jgi:fermentation-respiration switch protein FrsA (DUF1100 family)
MRLLLLALVLLGAGCTFQLREDHFFHPGPVEKADDTAKWQLPAGYIAADVMIPMADGTRLHAVRVRREGAGVEVLYFGGDVFRTETFGAMTASAIAEHGANALLVDYRGYGRSEGKPTIALVQSDALAVYDWLRGQTSLPIVVHGFSLGSFMAAHLAAERHPEGLVLESTATNPTEWAKLQTPAFVRVRMPETLRAQDNTERLKTYKGPLLIVAGDKDRITPVSMSRTLLDAAASTDKQLYVSPGASHGAALAPAAARAAYGTFLARIAKAQ